MKIKITDSKLQTLSYVCLTKNKLDAILERIKLGYNGFNIGKTTYKRIMCDLYGEWKTTKERNGSPFQPGTFINPKSKLREYVLYFRKDLSHEIINLLTQNSIGE